MPLWQCERLVTRDGAENGHAQLVNGVNDQGPMPFAADAIENDAGKTNRRIIGCEASDDGCCRLRLSGDVENK